MKLMVRTATPATPQQQTLDLIRNDPLIKYRTVLGQLFRLEMEIIE
jgi:hypothetical protein